MYSTKLWPGRRSMIVGRFIKAKMRINGIGYRSSAGTTGIYRYSLALLSVQISFLGVSPIAAFVVISLVKVLSFCSRTVQSLDNAADSAISASIVFFLSACATFRLLHRPAFRHGICQASPSAQQITPRRFDPAWHPNHRAASQDW